MFRRGYLTLCRGVALACIAGGVFLAGGGLYGCSSEPPPSFRQPECEPPDELLIERSLKEAFRFAYENKAAQALAAFERVLAIDPAHPEARAGKRAVQTSLTSPSAPRSLPDSD